MKLYEFTSVLEEGLWLTRAALHVPHNLIVRELGGAENQLEFQVADLQLSFHCFRSF